MKVIPLFIFFYCKSIQVGVILSKDNILVNVNLCTTVCVHQYLLNFEKKLQHHIIQHHVIVSSNNQLYPTTKKLVDKLLPSFH